MTWEKRVLEDIRGLYFKEDNEVIANGNRPLMNMNEIVFPYKEDENLDNKIVYYEASRGCPFNCKYCLIFNYSWCKIFRY